MVVGFAGLLQWGSLAQGRLPPPMRTGVHIRDWMHCLVGDGVANATIALMLHALKGRGIACDVVQEFSLMCTLPHKYGKVDKTWFDRKRLKDSTIASFASIILSMIPILYLFLEEFDLARHMPEEVACFAMLHHIAGLLRLGPGRATAHVGALRRLVQAFHRSFANLWPEHCKPKLHHLHHCIDAIEWLGACLSCFVAERKHRDVKKFAMHVFRNLEHTATASVLNAQCEQISEGIDIYKESFIVRPQNIHVGGATMQRGTTAVLHCGEVVAGDIVYCQNGEAGRVIAFWQQGCEAIALEMAGLACVRGDTRWRGPNETARVFLPAGDVIDACIHYTKSDGNICLCVPPSALHIPG